jgi:hypothetical protein
MIVPLVQRLAPVGGAGVGVVGQVDQVEQAEQPDPTLPRPVQARAVRRLERGVLEAAGEGVAVADDRACPEPRGVAAAPRRARLRGRLERLERARPIERRLEPLRLLVEEGLEGRRARRFSLLSPVQPLADGDGRGAQELESVALTFFQKLKDVHGQLPHRGVVGSRAAIGSRRHRECDQNGPWVRVVGVLVRRSGTRRFAPDGHVALSQEGALRCQHSSCGPVRRPAASTQTDRHLTQVSRVEGDLGVGRGGGLREARPLRRKDARI